MAGTDRLNGDFLMRLVRLLGHDSILDVVLASGHRFTYDELKALQGPSRLGTEAVDENETWQKLIAYTDERLGALLAIREELQRKINIERRRRLARRLSISER
jgi:hypothetical protein